LSRTSGKLGTSTSWSPKGLWQDFIGIFFKNKTLILSYIIYAVGTVLLNK
jgi:hypothetical protein